MHRLVIVLTAPWSPRPASWGAPAVRGSRGFLVALLALVSIVLGLAPPAAAAQGPAPTVSGLNAPNGPTTGGTTVTVTGTDFVRVSQVQLGGQPAAFIGVDPTHLQLTTPPHTAGAAAPIALSPSSGSTAGGTPVLITVPAVGDVSGVTLDGTALFYSLTPPGQTPPPRGSPAGTGELAVTMPLHGPGPVTLTVFYPGRTALPATYTYLDAQPTLTLTPNTGPTTGGTPVSLFTVVPGPGPTRGTLITVVQLDGHPLCSPMHRPGTLPRSSFGPLDARTSTATRASPRGDGKLPSPDSGFTLTLSRKPNPHHAAAMHHACRGPQTLTGAAGQATARVQGTSVIRADNFGH